MWDDLIYLFVIDTNKYAGNFEREMCAYMTGVGEYRGEDEKKVFKAEVDDNPLYVDKYWLLTIEQPVGDNPHLDYCYIFPNPAWFNNGLGGHFRKDDPDADSKALIAYKKHQEKRYKDQIKQAESNRKLPDERRKELGWTDEGIKKEVDRCNKEIEKANGETKITRLPAYNSVAIFLEDKPTSEQVAFLKERAHKFVGYCKTTRWLPKDLVIEGFRLLKREITHTEESI